MSENPRFTNALAKEKSPYLLQHAHNPVNWMPWGDAAFELARQSQKPIFLSIGYSTCHWCHVMERESFENEEIAKFLNEHFINVKVDREERPDVDLTYMTYVQAVNGSGGWPMNVWLTPDLNPFFGGTYFPPTDKEGRMGFKRLCEEIHRVWSEDQQNVIQRSAETVQKLQAMLQEELVAHKASYDAVMQKAYDDLSSGFDYHEGGFNGAPKFPRPVALGLLWRLKAFLAGAQEGEANWAQTMGQTTLSKMAAGGIWDHLGGGFHRYSVDAYWHIPHYEKMLYDQAQLVVAYLEGYQNTGREAYLDIVKQTLEYCQTDLYHAGGAYYSAEDADSFATVDADHKQEGAFYVWTAAEIDEVLGAQKSSIFRYAYGARRSGNARPESDPLGELAGTNTLFRAFSPKRTAEFFKLEEEEVQEILREGRAKLRALRAQRPRPHLDDKVVTSWNGLMLTALARAAKVLDEGLYVQRAKKCAEFIWQHLSDEGKNLQRSWRQGQKSGAAFATDYALLIQGLLDLYEASFELRWLQWAEVLQQEMDEKFKDPEVGGYFSVHQSIRHSVLQVKEDYDGAEPSPNSIAAMNLLRLSSMLSVESYRKEALRSLTLFGKHMEQSPTTVPAMVSALDFAQHGDMEVVCAGELMDPHFQALIKEVRSRYLPHAVVLHADGAENQAYLARHNEALKFMGKVKGQAAVYVCRNKVCQAPVTELATLKGMLDNLEA